MGKINKIAECELMKENPVIVDLTEEEILKHLPEGLDRKYIKSAQKCGNTIMMTSVEHVPTDPVELQKNIRNLEKTIESLIPDITAKVTLG